MAGPQRKLGKKYGSPPGQDRIFCSRESGAVMSNKKVFYKSQSPGGAITGHSGKSGAEVHRLCVSVYVCKVWRLAVHRRTDGWKDGWSAKHSLSPAFNDFCYQNVCILT